jgi:hypothetical protein
MQEVHCLARGLSRAILQGMVGFILGDYKRQREGLQNLGRGT